MKKAFRYLAGAMLVVLVLAACQEADISPADNDNNEVKDAENNEATNDANNANNNESNDANNNENNNDNEDGNEEAVEEGEADDLSIGDAIHFNDLHLTLNGVYRSEGSDFEEPNNDYFIIVDLSIDNNGAEAETISTMLQMSLLDDAGYSQDMTFLSDTRGSLDGEVGAGRTLAGEVAFDVQEGEYFEFIFENPFSSGQAIWTIDLSDIEER